MLDTNCPQCYMPLTGKDADVSTSQIHCPNCGHSMPLVQSIVAPGGNAYKEQIQQVDGLELNTMSGFHLRVPASLLANGRFMLGFGLLVLLISSTVLYFLLRSEEGFGFIFLILLVFPLVGLYLTYMGVARLTAVQEVFVKNQTLHSKQMILGGLPVVTHQLTVSDIDQFFVMLKEDGSSGEKVKVSFELHVKLNDGETVKLVEALRSPDHAYYIERQLEQHLGIEDRLLPQEFVSYEMESPFRKSHGEEGLMDIARWMSDDGQLTIRGECANCGAPLADGAVNEEDNIVQCAHCGELEVLHKAVLGENLNYADKKAVPQAVPGVVLTRGLGLEMIVQPQTGWGGIFGLLMVGAFIVIPLYLGIIPLQTGAEFTSLEDFLPFLFVIIPSLMLIGIIKNMTEYQRIAVESGQLVTERLLFNRIPRKRRTYQRSALEQLFVRQHEHRSSEGPTTYTYSLNAKLKQKAQPIKLIDSLKTPEQGYYLEQKLENHLGIEDQSIDGEYLERELFGLERPQNFREVLKLGRRIWRGRKREKQ